MEPVDPVTYPSVTLGGQTYRMRLTCGAAVRLYKEHGIDISKTAEGVLVFEKVAAIIAAAITDQAKMTVEEVADLIDFRDMQKYSEAVGELLGKPTAQATEATDIPAPTLQ